MDSIPHKTCTRCKQTKPLTEFRYGQCRQCLRALNAEYSRRPEAQEKRRVREREYNKRPEVRAKIRAYYDRPDVNERVKERERKRWQNDENLREYKRTYLRKRYHNNPDHKRKQFAYSSAALHRRRARKEANGGSYTAQEWRELCAKYDHLCLCCGEAKPLTVDHVVPLVEGGSNDISNIQPLCLDCNLRKATKTIDYRPT